MRGNPIGGIPSVPVGKSASPSVANLTRRVGLDSLRQAPAMDTVTHTTAYSPEPERANEALADLPAGRFEGAGVLAPLAREGQLRVLP